VVLENEYMDSTTHPDWIRICYTIFL